LRRLLGFLVTAGTLVLAGFIGFTLISSWLNPEPLSIGTVDGRTFISVQQPAQISWTAPLDNSGYDVSHPQCKSKLPSSPVGFVIVGLNKGKPFTSNPCFETQWNWAKTHDGVAVYINTADPNDGSATRYGKSIASDTIKRLKKFNVPVGTPVWLDVETHNTWSTTDRAAQVISETMAQLSAAGYPVGIYGPPAHWFEITGDANLGVPTWLALGKYPDIASGVAAAKAACTTSSFGLREPAIVQFVATVGRVTLDRNYMCLAPTGLVAPVHP
jgi:hypothetical protein